MGSYQKELIKMDGANERCTPINVIKGRQKNLIGRTREPEYMRISRLLQKKLISGIEINLSATRGHYETLMMK